MGIHKKIPSDITLQGKWPNSEECTAPQRPWETLLLRHSYQTTAWNPSLLLHSYLRNTQTLKKGISNLQAEIKTDFGKILQINIAHS